uniref:Uncharacterized protein n=1 Tax=Anguilla anguilla TaxID=7936 RepID=A0A0E9TAF3_ANGAN
MALLFQMDQNEAAPALQCVLSAVKLHSWLSAFYNLNLPKVGYGVGDGSQI